MDGPLPKRCPAVALSRQDGHHSAVALLLKAALIQVSDYRLLGASGHCSKKRRRSPSNIKLETSQCIHGKISFQDGNTKINHSSPPCGGVGVHLRSARCIPINSHVSTSQEVSEVLCTGSSLSISSHALRHHSCTKGFYQTNGRSRWASPQSTNSHFYVSERLASQKSDSRIVTSSIKSNNTTSGRSRIDNQFRQMPFSAFTDNYLHVSGCSFQPEQGVSSPL